MIKSDSDIYRLIFERAKQWNTIKPRYKAEEEGEMSDSDDQSGTIQLFSVSGETYDFDKGTILSLKMSPKQIEQLLFDLSPYNRGN